MIENLVGKVIGIEKDYIIVDFHNMLLKFFIISEDYEKFSFGDDKNLHIIIKFYNITSIQAFAFLNKESKKIFNILMSVKNVDYKTIFNIFNNFKTEELCTVIKNYNIDLFVDKTKIRFKTSEEIFNTVNKIYFYIKYSPKYKRVIKALLDFGYSPTVVYQEANKQKDILNDKDIPFDIAVKKIIMELSRNDVLN